MAHGIGAHSRAPLLVSAIRAAVAVASILTARGFPNAVSRSGHPTIRRSRWRNCAGLPAGIPVGIRAPRRAALGLGLFVPTWAVVYLIGKAVGYAFSVPAYAEAPDGYVVVVLIVSGICQLVALAVGYFFFAWAYGALGGTEETPPGVSEGSMP